MSTNKKIEAMNRARQIQEYKTKIKSLKAQINLLQSQNERLRINLNNEVKQNKSLLEDIKKLQDENSLLHCQIEKLSQHKIEKQIKNHLEEISDANNIFSERFNPKNIIIRDLVEKEVLQSDHYFFPETIYFASTIRSISPKCYEYIRKNIPFPTPYICDFKEKQFIGDFPKQLIHLDYVPSIIKNWKNFNNICKTTRIYACLSVDALFFHPDIKINENNIIEGIKLGEDVQRKLPNDMKKIFTVHPDLFESFVQFYWKDVTKAGFVFQMQSYDVKFKPVVLNIKPTANGKATEEIVFILNNLRSVLKNQNIIVKSYAFDGDSAYKNLHLSYYYSYIYSCFKNTLNLKKVNSFRVVSDFLHIIKRLRYRLLSGVLHAGFNINNSFIDISNIKNVLSHLPNVVFNNGGFTKMHDRLPLLLFGPDSFVKLFENKQFTSLAYWFPITSAMIAMDCKDLSKLVRKFFLECSFWFLVYYAKIKELIPNNIKQKKRKDLIDVCFYTNELLIEFTNTIHCHLQLLETLSEYSFDRNSSMPLEHLFGRARVKAKNIHTLKKFIKNISEFQNIDAYKQDEKIAGRRSSFGVSVSNSEIESEFIDKNNEFSIYDFNPRNIALCALILGGFEEAFESIQDFTPIYWFCEVIQSLIPEDDNQKKKHRMLSLNSLTVGTNRGFRASALIKSQCPSITLNSNFGKFARNNSKSNMHDVNIELIKEYFRKKMKNQKYEPTIEDLNWACTSIKNFDPLCSKIPNEKHSLECFYHWFGEHYREYEIYLYSLI